MRRHYPCPRAACVSRPDLGSLTGPNLTGPNRPHPNRPARHRRHQEHPMPATNRSDKSAVSADGDARGQGAVERAQDTVDDEQQAVDQAQGVVDDEQHAVDQAQGVVEDDQQAVDRMQEAVDEAATIAEETGGLGRPGRPMNKRSPFFVGMSAAAGVAVTYGLVELVIRARAVLVLIGLALFIAAGLEPAVSWLTRHRFPRWAAVTTILLIAVGVFAGFLAAAIPPLTTQATALANQLPHYLHTLQD